MTRRRRLRFAMFAMFALMMLSLVTPAMSFASHDVPASCPVTLPSHPAFIPPGPYPKTPPRAPHSFWHGMSGLWTMLRPDGTIGTRDKQFWWSPGFRPTGPPEPLKIQGRRLDGKAPPLAQPWVTNAHAPEFGGWTMLTMLELPARSCWEVTASYGADSVTFVVWVTPTFG